MIDNPTPTRAEASDCATAIFDSADAGELASSSLPLSVCLTLSLYLPIPLSLSLSLSLYLSLSHSVSPYPSLSLSLSLSLSSSLFFIFFCAQNIFFHLTHSLTLNACSSFHLTLILSVMLSAESAAGKYPVESVTMQQLIINKVEVSGGVERTGQEQRGS